MAEMVDCHVKLGRPDADPLRQHIHVFMLVSLPGFLMMLVNSDPSAGVIKTALLVVLGGGIVIGAGVSLIISHYWTELPWNRWVALAILISCFGTLGDLVESMFKRSLNVKDSGSILPGHGGLLDRFDGLLLAAPVVYAYLYCVLNN